MPYLDAFPDLAFARNLRARARGIAIRDALGRAAAVAWVSDGSTFAPDTLVRFDVVQGEDPSRRLADAFAATGTRAIWFYGGDDGTRRAVIELGLELTPVGAAYVRRVESRVNVPVALHAPSDRDRRTLGDLLSEHAAAFAAPETLIAEIKRDRVGIAVSETLDERWSEMRVAVYPSYRGQGFGAAIVAAAADALERSGRLVCAATEGVDSRARHALEAAGFRVADYYFIGRRPNSAAR